MARDSGLSAKDANGAATPIKRDARGVVGVAVAVGVDRAVEACDQLVGAGVDDAAALGVGLPAGDANREDRRGRRDARAGRPGPPEPTSSPAICVPCRSTSSGSCGLGLCVGRGGAVDEVEPRIDAAVEVRLRAVDAGVEQRDREPAAVVPRQLTPGTSARALRERLRRDGGGERGAHRVDARPPRAPRLSTATARESRIAEKPLITRE